MTPVKPVGRGDEARIVPDEKKLGIGEYVTSQKLYDKLEQVQKRADAKDVAVIPGAIVDPRSKRFKKDLSEKLQSAGIEINLDLGNFIVGGKDLSNKTVQNLYVTGRTSRKFIKGTDPSQTRPTARIHMYDNENLTVDQMKKNYRFNTGEKNPLTIRTNLVQPERFSVLAQGETKRLNYPIERTRI
jgi:hypothetical protein